MTLSISRLPRDQRRLDAPPPRDCWVRVENNRKRLYIRRGLNQSNGSIQRDCFILRRDGTIEGDINWDYDESTRVEARPMDERPLVLKGGVFTTTANRMKQAKGYNYWSRNIAIHRSNTTVVGLTHHIVSEPNAGEVKVFDCEAMRPVRVLYFGKGEKPWMQATVPPDALPAAICFNDNRLLVADTGPAQQILLFAPEPDAKEMQLERRIGASKPHGVKHGRVEIFRVGDGSSVGRVEPSDDVGEIGLQDIRECLAAHRRASPRGRRISPVPRR